MWKPKEKEISIEEATELAQTELAPFWFGSHPLLVGICIDENNTAVPLDKSFNEKSWLIFFVDITEISTETFLIYIKEWFNRYQTNHLGMIMVIQPVYDYFKEAIHIRSFIDHHEIRFPVTVDSDGALTQSFLKKFSSKFFLVSRSKNIFEFNDVKNLESLELKIQKFLRGEDPGLSLLPIFKTFEKKLNSTNRVEFGARPKIGSPVKYPGQGFIETSEGTKIGHFNEKNFETIQEDEIFISGQWVQDDDKITTIDPSAFIFFKSPSSYISIIASSSSRSVETPFIQVEIEGISIYEEILGTHMHMESTGEAHLSIREPKAYSMLKALPSDQRYIYLRFPEANIRSICLYGMRFGNE